MRWTSRLLRALNGRQCYRIERYLLRHQSDGHSILSRKARKDADLRCGVHLVMFTEMDSLTF